MPLLPKSKLVTQFRSPLTPFVSGSNSRRGSLQGRGSGCVPTPSDLCSWPGSQFHEARSLCQSRHAVKAAVIPTAAPTATSNATIIAMIATKVVSVIEVRRRVYARSSAGRLIALRVRTY